MHKGFSVAGICVFALFAMTVAGSASAGGHMFFAAPGGTGTACKANAPCSLTTAIATAPAGSTVKALPGVYQGGVSFSKQLDLEGQAAVLDATTSPDGYGIEVSGPGGSGSVIEGWTVTNAQFSGILIGSHIVDATGTPRTNGSPISDVTVDHVTVENNDQGFSGEVGAGAGECFTTPFAPGDCGEGIHLVSATDSTIEHSLVQNNAGGILMTDEFGPATGNTIAFDSALNNNDDCGITIASHTTSQIYGNVIENNVADGNGVAGQGAGILMAGAGFGTGVHDNVISNNEASGNGLSGITIHDHFPGNFNNNVITNNHLGTNNLDGDFDFLTPDPQTTGILVAAGPPNVHVPPPAPITGTVISNNQISDNEVGIWTLHADAASTTIDGNQFHNVTTEISTN
jgi:nitrous oxidase accessory protein NosD